MTDEQRHKWITIEVMDKAIDLRTTSHHVIHYETLLELQDEMASLIQATATEIATDFPVNVLGGPVIENSGEIVLTSIPPRFVYKLSFADAYTEEQMIRLGLLGTQVDAEVWGHLWDEQEARRLMETI